MAKQHGGYENIGCLEKDVRNHLDKSRRLSLESGDANAMLECFMTMQEENPRFLYNLGDTPPLLDPRPSKTKGAPSQRMKSGIEKGRKRRKKVRHSLIIFIAI
jgi:hypothetical protein